MGPGQWRRARVVAGLAALLALVSLYPDPVPNAGPRVGSLLETFQPWLPLAVLPLAVAALWRRSALALGACALPGAAWLIAHGGTLLVDENAPYDLTALQHNVSDVNPDPAGTARKLAEAKPDLIALEEVTPAALPAYREVLSPTHPHIAVEGTVSLWSRHPLTDIRPVDIRPKDVPRDWRRGLRATAHTPKGEIAVYVAHLPSVRMSPSSGFGTARRDESARYLGRAIEAEETDRVLLMGDLNSTVADRGLSPVTSQLHAPAGALAFSWPASLPLARIDQILARNAKIAHIRALDRTGSDHLPVLARVRF
ncbi:endonuclease/exonuclease/phosphatase family protein [Streptomyces qinzhouensis]|uniref:Endonuclease/exonuclease/phosphatase family protein n=1 Tax=Streptomyces qinzhouensis TaxID=2599401 RepID=A0A5B8IRM4_9ACTN|nr:endonuclease/exonuclease/phosphatase family protein [Streptomyces qinzhouensis]